MTSDHMVSAEPIGEESRPSKGRNKQVFSRPIGSDGDHVLCRHEFLPKAGDTNKRFLGLY